MRRIAALCSAAGFVVAMAMSVGAGHATEALAPYQMVRSLQLVQDRIASGDQAALPMQAKLLELTDARLRKVSAEELKEPKNLRALLVYGMSGGNPATIEAATARIEMDAGMQAISTGVLAYLSGRPADAIKALEPVDPMTLPSDLGAFVALVKGSLLATDDPAQALALLDKARLLSPGTLVEEAALRRTVGITAANGDAARFAHASTQYVERYLRSPYASQFADAFVSGIIAMNQALSRDKLADITAMMDAERSRVIYLRIARRAAIDGLNELSAFAAAKAVPALDGKGVHDDPRAALYASLSAVTSATVDDLREKLKAIDRNRLSEADRALYDAAEAVTHEIVAPPPAASAPPAPPLAAAVSAPAPTAGGTADAEVPATQETADLLPVEGAIAERPATQAASEQPAPPAAVPVTTPPAAVAAATPPASAVASTEPAQGTAGPSEAVKPIDAADATIADARRKLAQIDQMLGTSPQ